MPDDRLEVFPPPAPDALPENPAEEVAELFDDDLCLPTKLDPDAEAEADPDPDVDPDPAPTPYPVPAAPAAPGIGTDAVPIIKLCLLDPAGEFVLLIPSSAGESGAIRGDE